MTSNSCGTFSVPTVLSLLAWLTTNITTVILNKFIYEFTNFKQPFTLTCIHMFVCCLGSLLFIHSLHLTKWQRINVEVLIRKVFPLAALFILNILLGNISLRWVSVSFMQTVKASVPVFNVLLQVMIYSKQFSTKIYLTLIPIVGGVVLATWTEAEFDAIGFWCALTASVTTALMAIVSGAILEGQLDSLNLLYYMAPLSFLMMLPLSYVIEGSNVSLWMETATFGQMFILFISGAIAYLLNVTTFLVIAYSSPLTYNVAGNFKVTLTVILSVVIFKNKITIWNAIGCGVAIIGVGVYNYIRQFDGCNFDAGFLMSYLYPRQNPTNTHSKGKEEEEVDTNA